MKNVFLLWALLHAVTLGYGQQSAIRNVSVGEFKRAMDSLNNEVIVDVRTAAEVSEGKIPGAIAIDFYGDNFKETIGALDKNKPYLLYCAGGIRSGKTAALMRDMGFRKIYNLEDGYKGWVKARMATEKK